MIITISYSKTAPLTQKVIFNRHIKEDGGTLKLWGTYACIIPLYTFLGICENLGENTIKFLTELGYAQGYSAVNFIKQKFGINDFKCLTIGLEQSEIVGAGKITITKMKDNYCKFKINNNFEFYQKYYSQETIQNFNIYVFNVIKGIYDVSKNVSTKLTITSKTEFVLQHSNSKCTLNKHLVKQLSKKIIIY